MMLQLQKFALLSGIQTIARRRHNDRFVQVPREFNDLTKPIFSRKIGLEKSQISYCTGTWELKIIREISLIGDMNPGPDP